MILSLPDFENGQTADKLAPKTAAHLGEVLYVSGNREEAKAVFEKALKDFPENGKVKETMKRFLP